MLITYKEIPYIISYNNKSSYYYSNSNILEIFLLEMKLIYNILLIDTSLLLLILLI
jgi:hypothetical protein